jgi:phosphatidylglycerol:prolipoprotein diacylglycerol transferase
MHSELFHMYGPISVQWYGLMIFIGLLIFLYAFLKDSRRKPLISTEQAFDCVTLGIISAIIGGRLLFLFTNWNEINSFYDSISLWDGGLSLLGAITGVALVVPVYMKVKHLQVFALMDLTVTYVPLLQSISRLGCFMAGCCYGSQTSVCWAVPHEHILVHPTQLYSSFLLFIIFLVMLVVRSFLKNPGQLACLYLILESGERFIIDFFRGDREFIASSGFWGILSVHQYIALVLGLVALIIMIMITVRAQYKHESV